MATILIADDRAVNRQYLATLLAYCGYRVLEAADGREALEIAKRERPELVISDVLMPVMDGAEFARGVRADPEIAATPIIFYTATYRARDARALAAGCGVHHVLTKPCEPQAILDTVKSVLGIDQHPVAPAGQSGPDRTQPEGTDQPPSDLQMIGMRLSSLIEVALDLGGERDPAVLVERFCRAAQDIISTKFAAVGMLGRDGKTIRHFITSWKEEHSAEPVTAQWVTEFAENMPAMLAGRPSLRMADVKGAGGAAHIAGHENLLAVEIRSGERVVGWLFLSGKLSVGEFSLADEQIALTLGAQLAVFYESARLHAESQAHAAQLELEMARRTEAEVQLRKLSRAVECSPAAIVITDTGGLIEYVNPKFETITGYTAAEVLGKNPRILNSGETPPEVYRQMWTTICAGGEWRGEFHNRRKDGGLFWELASISAIRDAGGKITHFVAVKEDITERKKLGEQFLRAQRLESIGALASGVAHDLNNILAPILMCAPLLRGNPGPERFEAMVSAIEASASRGAQVVAQMLTFMRGSGGGRQPLRLQHLLAEMEQVIAESFPKSIHIELYTGAGLWDVKGDATQLLQVLMNLCVNARDAMPGGGKLRLRVENITVDATYASMLRGGRAGSFVVVEVSDTGTGIPPELQDRVFDGFFTTKTEGHGTGLGLATVRRIVGEHEGFLTLQSEPGKGTTFRIFLPAQPGAAADPTAAAAAPAPRGGHGEMILVVDDEASIRTVAQTVLQMHGYEVLTAADGAEAIAIYSQHSARIAAVVTDLVMPFMDGVSLIGALRRISPGVKVIVTSGFADKSRLAALQTLNLPPLLVKPYPIEALLSALDRVLHSDDVEMLSGFAHTLE